MSHAWSKYWKKHVFAKSGPRSGHPEGPRELGCGFFSPNIYSHMYKEGFKPKLALPSGFHECLTGNCLYRGKFPILIPYETLGPLRNSQTATFDHKVSAWHHQWTQESPLNNVAGIRTCKYGPLDTPYRIISDVSIVHTDSIWRFLPTLDMPRFF